jgi:hypothetical protein
MRRAGLTRVEVLSLRLAMAGRCNLLTPKPPIAQAASLCVAER